MKKSGSSLIIVCTSFAFISLMLITGLRSSGFLLDLAVQRIERAKKEAILEGILSYAIARSLQESATVPYFIWIDSNNNAIQVTIESELTEKYKNVALYAEKDGILYGRARAELISNNGAHLIREWNISPT